MSSKYITLQIIPESSGKVKTYRISRMLLTFIKIFAVIFVIALAAFIYEFATANYEVVKLQKVERENKMLREKQAQYDEYFATLDSIFIKDLQIQHILGVFTSEDSVKIHTMIEKSQLIHKIPEKNEIDFENRWGSWRSPAEKLAIDQTPDVIPVSGVISKGFDETNHIGLDYAAANGDPVYASGAGKVTSVAETADLGLTITINHQNGYISTYSHLSASYVQRGNNISKGHLIGAVGSTGKSSGPHLHYTLQKNGKPENPEKFFNY